MCHVNSIETDIQMALPWAFHSFFSYSICSWLLAVGLVMIHDGSRAGRRSRSCLLRPVSGIALLFEAQWHMHQNTKLLCPIDGDARMHPALPIEESAVGSGAGVSVDSIVPHARVDVAALARRHVERGKVCGFDVITNGWREVGDERLAIFWIEELATVRVVVGIPQSHAARRLLGRRAAFARLAVSRRLAVTQQIMVGFGRNRVILPIKQVSIPVDVELALGRTGLIAAAWVHWPPSLRWPHFDLECALLNSEVIRVITTYPMPFRLSLVASLMGTWKAFSPSHSFGSQYFSLLVMLPHTLGLVGCTGKAGRHAASGWQGGHAAHDLCPLLLAEKQWEVAWIGGPA